MATFSVFVDAGFLRMQGADAVKMDRQLARLDARSIADWCQSLSTRDSGVFATDRSKFLRIYWYDGAFAPNHELFEKQSRYLSAVAGTPGVQVCLGHIAEREPSYAKPLKKALRQTAEGLNVDSSMLMNEFIKHWKFVPERRQKGVDTLIALDLVRFAIGKTFDTAVLISGDRDLAGAVKAIQDLGCRVVIAMPDRRNVARELFELADELILIDSENLKRMFR